MPFDRRPSSGFSFGRLVLLALLLVVVAALAWDQFGPAQEDQRLEIPDDGATDDDAALGETADETGGELQDEAQELDQSVDQAEPQTGEVLEDATESEAEPVEDAVEDSMDPASPEEIAPEEEQQGN